MPANIQLFLTFLRLGLTSFGGPVAHLGFFREEFVTRRRWFSEEQYADKVALCQLIPGPASSQVGLLIGYARAGYLGALLAWLGFTLPSAVLLGYLGITLSNPENLIPELLLSLLKAIALAVVLQAVIGMAKSFCNSRLHWVLMLTSAVILTLTSTPWMTPLLLVAAGLVTFQVNQERVELQARAPKPSIDSVFWLGIFFSGLVLLPVISTTINPALELISDFYRAGALVFGGGHVVLPLLADSTVHAGLVSPELFISGYGAAQAVPGPLFTFSAFLGGVVDGSVLGATLATLAIFLPAVAILFGVRPIWEAVKIYPAVRLAIAGANAAVVGVLLAALLSMMQQTTASIELLGYVAVAFVLIERFKVPAWILVVAAAIASYGLGSL